MTPAPRTKEATRDARDCCDAACCGPGAECCGTPAKGSCRVDAVVPIDARGQMVLPKEVRERFGIRGEQRWAVVSWTQDGRPCCLSLVPADEVADAVRRTYGPVLRELVGGG